MRARISGWRARWGLGGLLGIAWLAAVVWAAVFGQFFTGNIDQNLRDRLAAPSLSHPFGTNNLGMDLFLLAIEGARVSVVVGLCATAIGVVVGVPLGLAAALFKGAVDRATLVFLDTFAAFPSFVAAIAVVLFMGKSIVNIVVIIGVLSAPFFARISRALAMSLVQRDFVLAAEMMGAGRWRVVRRELVPNVSRTVIGFAMIAVGVAIGIEGGLSFFGAGVPDDTITWGQLVAQGRSKVDAAPHVSVIPAALILLTILSLNSVSERWQQGPPLSLDETPPPQRPDDAIEPDRTPTADVVLSVESLYTHLMTPFGDLRAVDGVSLDLRRGEMLAIVGESGSGKTMLARSILGLVPTPPRRPGTAGRILFDGRDLTKLSDDEMRAVRGRRIAMVFQDPMTTLDPVMRIGMQIAEPAMVHLGLSKSQAMSRAADLLAEVGVPDPAARLRAWPHELSGGLRQRVSVAIALAADPDVLIADEPTSALDVTVQRQLLDLLDGLRKSRGLSVVLITHDMGIVASRADTVFVMYSGRIVEQGPTAEVFADPRMPYTRALLAAIPRVDDRSHRRLAVIGGTPPVPIGVQMGCSFAPRCREVEDRCRIEVPSLAGETHRDACHLNRRPA